jgi:hypothetical protein
MKVVGTLPFYSVTPYLLMSTGVKEGQLYIYFNLSVILCGVRMAAGNFSVIYTVC